VNVRVITASTARSAKRRHMSYSEADFEVFGSAGRHVAPIGVKFGTEEWTEDRGRQISPHRCNDKSRAYRSGPPKQIFTEISHIFGI